MTDIRGSFEVQLIGFDAAIDKQEALEASSEALADSARRLRKALREVDPDENADEYQALAKQLGSVKTQQNLVKEAARQNNRAMKEQVKEVKAVAGSYNALKIKQKSLLDSMRNINLSTKQGQTELKGLRKQLNLVNRDIANFERSTGSGRLGFFDQLNKSNLGALTTGLAGAIGVGVGLSETVRLVGDLVEVYREGDESLNSLSASFGVAKSELDPFIDSAERLAKQTVGFTEEEILQAQALSAAFGRNREEIEKLVPAALDLAVAQGISLESAVRNLNKSFSGQRGELGELLPGMQNLTKAQLENGAAVELVTELYDGQAQAQRDNADAAIIFKEAVQDLRGDIGGVLLAELDLLKSGLVTLVGFFQPVVTFFKERLPEAGTPAADTLNKIKDAVLVVTTPVIGLLRILGQYPGEIELAFQKTLVQVEGFGRGVLNVFGQLILTVREFVSALANPRALIKGDVSLGFENFGEDMGAAFNSGFATAYENRREKIEAAEKKIELARQKREEQAGKDSAKKFAEGYEQQATLTLQQIRAARIKILKELIKSDEDNTRARVELLRLQAEQEIAAFKGTQAQQEEFARIRNERLDQEISDVTVRGKEYADSFVQAIIDTLEGEEQLEGLVERKILPLGEEDTTRKERIRAYVQALADDLEEIVPEIQVATQDIFGGIGTLFDQNAASIDKEIASLEDMIATREEAGESTKRQEIELERAQRARAKAQERGARLAAAQAAAEQTLALTLALAGLAKDLGKGFPTNLVAVASTLGLIGSTFAAYRNLSQEFQRTSFAEGGDLSISEGGSVDPAGGMISGRSHSAGGVKGTYRGAPVEMEGGEALVRNGSESYVMNKRSMANPQLRAIASWVNEQGGGRAFAHSAGMTRRMQFGGAFSSGVTLPGSVINAADNTGFREFADAIDRRFDRMEVVVSSEKMDDSISRNRRLQEATVF